VVVCSLCGSDDWETSVVQANAMEAWLGKFVDMSNGVPSVRTFVRIFGILKPEHLNQILLATARTIGSMEESDIISFDGKSMRGTASEERGLRAIHMLNTWSHEKGICIGHMKVDDKSNEIPALPKLMELLDLKGAIITADAMHTQRATASKAIELGADYVLPIKGNQGCLLEEVELLFQEAQQAEFQRIDGSYFETLEKGHGRVEGRKYYSIDAEELPIAKDWKELRSVGMVIRDRTYKGKTSREVQYYISSCEIDAKLLEKTARGQWGIEGSLHWMLDVVFREDQQSYRDRIGA
jgi:predicted transposase YbfD/YdcC